LRFDSTDIGLTEEFLSMAYTKMSIGGHAERTRAQVSRETMGSLSVDELSFDYDMSHDATVPIGKICFCNVRSGGIVRQYLPDGTEGTFGAGDVFMYAPHDRPYAGVIQGARYNLMMFDSGLLDQVAATAPGDPSEHVRLTGDRPVSPGATRQLRSMIAYLYDHVLADPAMAEAPLVVSNVSQHVAACVLSAFPHNALLEPSARDSRDAHPATVRRAIAYIDAHAGEPVTLADIAAAVGTTARAVQAGFCRHLGTTPMGYLRWVRLDGAHRDLQAADPTSGATVAAIAARWGFRPMGRFTSFYQEQYGALPQPHPAFLTAGNGQTGARGRCWKVLAELESSE
jgi:AraC-like DNA-binding protein